MFDIWPVMNKCTVVAKREILYAWPFGLAAWLCGLIFIDRMHTDRARDKLTKASDFIKTDQIKLWVFPEGTRRNTGEIHSFRKGAFHVALDAQLPILPVVFSSYRTFLDDKNKRLNSGKIIISTLAPIPTHGMTKADLDSLMQHTHALMSQEYHQISNEVHEEWKFVQEQQQATTIVNGTSVGVPPAMATAHNERVPAAFMLEEPNVFGNQYSFMPAPKSVVTSTNWTNPIAHRVDGIYKLHMRLKFQIFGTLPENMTVLCNIIIYFYR